jgi:hypothetical protein
MTVLTVSDVQQPFTIDLLLAIEQQADEREFKSTRRRDRCTLFCMAVIIAALILQFTVLMMSILEGSATTLNVSLWTAVCIFDLWYIRGLWSDISVQRRTRVLQLCCPGLPPPTINIPLPL